MAAERRRTGAAEAKQGLGGRAKRSEQLPPTTTDLAESLRRPLAFAARDGFANLPRVQGLGATLRGATDRLLAALRGGDADSRALADWRVALDEFEGSSGVD